ncbi:MAG: helix-turn-helix domain-containing protein [Phycisphaerales bacterium]
MPHQAALLERLRTAVGQRTFSTVAEATGTSAETVRRYLAKEKTPSIEFLAALCRAYNLNAHWLLMGAGPMLRTESPHHALQQGEPAELLFAVADALEQLVERVERLESIVHAIESQAFDPPAAIRAPRHAGDEGGIAGTIKPAAASAPQRSDRTGRRSPRRSPRDAG